MPKSTIGSGTNAAAPTNRYAERTSAITTAGQNM